MNHLSTRVSAITLALGFIAAGSTALAEVGVTGTEVTIGVVNQQTSTIAPSGLGIAAGLRAAFEQANAAGGINGRSIKLNIYDDAYDPAKTVEQTRIAINNDHVFALTGYNATAPIKAVFPLLSKGDVPWLFPRTGDQFVRDASYKMIFNFRATFDDELIVLVKDMDSKSFKKVAFLYQPDALGDAIRSSAVAALKKAGLFNPDKQVSPFIAEGIVPRNSSLPADFKAAFEKIKASKPDAVILGCSSRTAAEVVKLAAQEGQAWAWYATNNTNALSDMLGDLEPNLIFSQVVPPYDGKSAFNNEYRGAMKAIGQEKDINFISYEGYLNGRIITEAIRRSGKNLSRETFIKSLEGDAFKYGEVEVDWSPTSHNARGAVFLTKFKGKKLVGL